VLRISPIARSSLFALLAVATISLMAPGPSSAQGEFGKNKASPASLRWAEGAPGCTFSRDEDGKYRYALWTDDYGIILAVDSQELDKIHHRVEPFFGLRITVRYRGKETLAVDPGQASLEFVKHFKVIQTSLDPEAFAARVQNDADELEYQTEREVRKHPERREEREKYVQTYQKEVIEFLDFLTQRTLPAIQLDPIHNEVSGWVLFSTKNKWLGDWKKPEAFLLRFPIADKIVEFPFELPAQQGDLILRRRPQ
jgi:hypothetical protein